MVGMHAGIVVAAAVEVVVEIEIEVVAAAGSLRVLCVD